MFGTGNTEETVYFILLNVVMFLPPCFASECGLCYKFTYVSAKCFISLKVITVCLLILYVCTRFRYVFILLYIIIAFVLI